MSQSDQLNELATALARAQGQMDSAKKDADNPFFKSKYADLASVVNAIRAPFSENGLAYVQLPVPCEGDEVAVDTVLMHASGQWISSRTQVPVTKQDAQGYGSALTYARRYGLQAIAGVAADDDDGNAAASAKPKPRAARLPERPVTPAPPGETGEQQDDRLFKTPAEEEREEKVAILERVARGFASLGLDAKQQEAKWFKHSGGVGPVLDPDGISLDGIRALLEELLTLAAAAKSREKK